jgi:hypothetical protein
MINEASVSESKLQLQTLLPITSSLRAYALDVEEAPWESRKEFAMAFI